MLFLLVGLNARGDRAMDSILMIMIGSVLCVTTGLTFAEVRRIRKKMDAKK